MRTRKPWTPLETPLDWEVISGRLRYVPGCSDELEPNPNERYGVYAVGDDGKPVLLVTTDCEPGVGVGLCTIGRERQLEHQCAGILDRMGAKNERWLSLPWAPLDRL